MLFIVEIGVGVAVVDADAADAATGINAAHEVVVGAVVVVVVVDGLDLSHTVTQQQRVGVRRRRHRVGKQVLDRLELLSVDACLGVFAD